MDIPMNQLSYLMQLEYIYLDSNPFYTSKLDSTNGYHYPNRFKIPKYNSLAELI